MSLRRLLWRYEARVYHDFMTSGFVVAGLFNAQRHKASDKWWTFEDFHPMHRKAKPKGAAGIQVLSSLAGWYAGEIQWAPGHGPDSIGATS